MKTCENDVVVSIVSDDERKEVLRFIAEGAYRAHQCAPPPSLGVIFAARMDDVIVGSMSVDFGDDEHPFPIEVLHRYDRSFFPEPFDYRNIVQGGRWFVMVKGKSVSEALYACVAEYLSTRSIRWFFVEAKPHSYKRLCDLGFTVYSLPSTLISENVPEDGARYYFEGPPPELYIVDVESMRRALAHYRKSA